MTKVIHTLDRENGTKKQAGVHNRAALQFPFKTVLLRLQTSILAGIIGTVACHDFHDSDLMLVW